MSLLALATTAVVGMWKFARMVSLAAVATKMALSATCALATTTAMAGLAAAKERATHAVEAETVAIAGRCHACLALLPSDKQLWTLRIATNEVGQWAGGPVALALAHALATIGVVCRRQSMLAVSLVVARSSSRSSPALRPSNLVISSYVSVFFPEVNFWRHLLIEGSMSRERVYCLSPWRS